MGNNQWAIRVPLGKLHTERLVPLDEQARKLVESLLELRKRAGLELDRRDLVMRPGDKLASYHSLAATLARLTDLRWRLVVVGDGSAANPRTVATTVETPEGLNVTQVDWYQDNWRHYFTYTAIRNDGPARGHWLGVVLAWTFFRVPRALITLPFVVALLDKPWVRAALRRGFLPLACAAFVFIATPRELAAWLRVAIALSSFATLSLLMGSRFGFWLLDTFPVFRSIG